MVWVNGQESVGKLANVYPGNATKGPVLHLHVEAPLREASMWLCEEPLHLVADWGLELGRIMFASQQGLHEIFEQCSVHGQFSSFVDVHEEDGVVAVALKSVGSLAPVR
jgi:hypothetical protein